MTIRAFNLFFCIAPLKQLLIIYCTITIVASIFADFARRTEWD